MADKITQRPTPIPRIAHARRRPTRAQRVGRVMRTFANGFKNSKNNRNGRNQRRLAVNGVIRGFNIEKKFATARHVIDAVFRMLKSKKGTAVEKNILRGILKGYRASTFAKVKRRAQNRTKQLGNLA